MNDNRQETLYEFRNHPHDGCGAVPREPGAVQREHAAKAAAAASLQLTDATNAVRFQMMQNRLYLSNTCSVVTRVKFDR